MICRRGLLAALPALVIGPRAMAQGGPSWQPSEDEMNKMSGPLINITPDMADWFESLDRPDVAAGKTHNPNGPMATATSCCSAGDAYPIHIMKPATPPHGGTEENGIAVVTDVSKRRINIIRKNVDGSPYVETKFRSELEVIPPELYVPGYGKFGFKYSSDRVTREIHANPTDTAWAFLNVTYNRLEEVFCVVPLPWVG